jgi:hypothetical protein
VKFPLGRIVATPGAVEVLGCKYLDTRLAVVNFALRHQSGDWGIVDDEDKRANDQAVMNGQRILSAYMAGNTTIWVITEADRSVTTVLLPGEY